MSILEATGSVVQVCKGLGVKGQGFTFKSLELRVKS